ncbi:AAA family ATPase [Flavobacterium sp. D11R37]|uniref:AAA family ATPase n=1 Tax=Flavobacterium coralii TaxID=2838017 RepID=UPI001CA671D2|nr:ATP-binding protein [Flavobacterium coralii]MBY8963275.1 AAA family ATPase [Flavobacterium coralii]
MILYFKVANYKSISEPVILNFNASSIEQYEDSNVIYANDSRLLKSILLYGHNASGKSKILNAIDYFKWFINNSATESQAGDEIEVEPFKLSELYKGKPSLFEMGFIIGKTKYRYGFEADTKKIHKEWLLENKIKKEYPVFLRINQEFDIDFKRFENSDSLSKRTRENALFLSVAAQWNVKKAQIIDKWFNKIFNIHGIDDRNYRKVTIDLLNNDKYSNLVNKFIQRADLGISNIDFFEIPFTFEEIKESFPENMREMARETFESESKAIISIHSRFNGKNEFSGLEPFVFDRAESDGTKKYFNIIGILITAILEGRIVIIDEFDARLHSLLSKAIIKLFNSNQIKSKAQLLVASHDTALLDNEMLRKDQIYFVEKDFKGASKVTTLAEFKSREKDNLFNESYLGGKYGGIPFINDLESLFNNVKEK